MQCNLRFGLDVLLVGLVLAVLGSGLWSQEKLDPAGIWQLRVTRPGRPAMEPILRLEKAGDKLVGVLTDNQGRTTPVKDAQLKDGELTFRTIMKRDNQEFTFSYKGKLSADAIQGQVTANLLGRQLSFDFEGKRKKEDAQKVKTATTNIGGTWKLKVPYKNGNVFEPTLKLVQAGSSLTGGYVGEQAETAIADGLLLGDEFVFEVTRERDGKHFKLKYQGKVQGDTLKGSVDYDFDGLTGALDFEGKRQAAPDPDSKKKRDCSLKTTAPPRLPGRGQSSSEKSPFCYLYNDRAQRFDFDGCASYFCVSAT